MCAATAGSARQHGSIHFAFGSLRRAPSRSSVRVHRAPLLASPSLLPASTGVALTLYNLGRICTYEYTSSYSKFIVLIARIGARERAGVHVGHRVFRIFYSRGAAFRLPDLLPAIHGGRSQIRAQNSRGHARCATGFLLL